MKLYDFSLYAERRAELLAARQVKNAVSSLEVPGTIHRLKISVSMWMDLHRHVLNKNQHLETEEKNEGEVLEVMQRFAP